MLHGVSFEVGAGEVVTLARPQRRRQDDDLEVDHGHRRARARGSVRFDGNELIGLASNRIARARHRATARRSAASSPASTSRRILLLPPEVHARRPRASTASFELFPNLEGAAARARAPSSRAASSRCWRSAASCAPAPGCCCSTSRPRGSRRSSSSRSARPSARSRSKGFTILLVEQNFRFAATVADRLLRRRARPRGR